MDLPLPSPAERNGEWPDADLDRQAERVLAAEYPKHAERIWGRHRPGDRRPAPEVVRADWRRIRRNELTDAELVEFLDETGRIAERGKAAIAAAAVRRMPGVALGPDGRGVLSPSEALGARATEAVRRVWEETRDRPRVPLEDELQPAEEREVTDGV